MEGARPRYIRPGLTGVGWDLASTSPKNTIKGTRCTCCFPQPLSSSPSSSLQPPKLQAWCRCYLFYLTTFFIMMFPKVILTSFAIGALSVNALSVPVAREPTPEPEREFPS